MNYIDRKDIFPAEYGEKIVVFGSVTEQFRPTVSHMEWLSNEVRWEIELLWESGCHSRVYSSDKGNVWINESKFKPTELN